MAERNETTMDGNGIRCSTGGGQIYKLIGQAIGKIGAIGKEKRNAQQGFMYRGIDQVYNALNPVMAELGIFFCPEVIDQKRDERVTKTGTMLTYTLLTMRFTAYAPDGSNVSMTVVGEGMDSGDKSSNKAMSVAMKYAMFQLFCIPTEEMKDPDADVYTDILPRGMNVDQKGAAQNQAQAPGKAFTPPQAGASTTVTTGAAVPQNAAAPAPQQAAAAPKQAAPNPNPREGEAPGAFIARRISEMKAEIPGFNFMAARAELIKAQKVPDVPSATMNMEQARTLVSEVHAWYEGKKAS